jgi:pseudouridine-5'-phosphate glycosidase
LPLCLDADKNMNSLEALPAWIELHPDVRQGLRTRQPVVALETTVVTHGLPKPINFELAMRMQQEIRSVGAVPASIALLKGKYHVGLSDPQLEQLALESESIKINRRELGIQRALRSTGGTTVAATMFLAHMAGIPIFATGGIGGVHRGDSGDISADLPELAQTPVIVVCSGAKAILDLPRTLEWLETHSVPVLGWQSDTFPAFFSAGGQLPVQARVDTIGEAADLMFHHWETGFSSGMLLCVPCPEAEALPAGQVESALEDALQEADALGISGKAVTPFLLDHISETTKGATLQANLALLRNNARVAAELAKAFVLRPTL